MIPGSPPQDVRGLEGTRPGGLGRIGRFLKAHPVLLLLLLTPGIPEYLSGSSHLNALVLNPVLFAFQLAGNLGLYGSGTLLIYEAKVRWKKGWVTVLLLGGAYGILEEGVALSTLFYSKAGPVGSLGYYGHWAGVNWVWAGGIVPFHALFSISLPIALLGMAVPETVGRSLLSRKQVALVAAILFADVAALMLVVNRTEGFWMGDRVFVGSLVVIGVLIVAGRRAPATALRGAGNPPLSSRRAFVMGVAFFPAVLLVQSVGQSVSLPAAADLAAELLVQGLFLMYVTRPGTYTVRGVVSLASGLVIPIALFGFVSELSLPMTLLADAALALFFRSLWKGGQPEEGASPDAFNVQAGSSRSQLFSRPTKTSGDPGAS